MIWNKKGLPHKGWRIVDVSDLRDPQVGNVSRYATCQMCGRRGIRYLYVMVHADITSALAVGRVCAEAMSRMYLAMQETPAQEG